MTRPRAARPTLVMAVALAAAAGASGCAHKPTGPRAPVIVTLSRTACFGVCPVYEVKVHADGLVLYEGKDFVKVKGSHAAQIEPEKVAELVQAFKRSGYFDLADSYDDERIADNAWVNVTHTHDGKTKSIRHYQGDKSAPEALGELEDQVDAIAGTARWVGTRDERDDLERTWMK